jgi:hypothetical protein
MSRENIEAVRLTKTGGEVVFKSRDGKISTYEYGKSAIKKIIHNDRDPADFKAVKK